MMLPAGSLEAEERRRKHRECIIPQAMYIYMTLVVVGDQGTEPRLRFAMQPLGLLYTLFSISSHCRRQMSPRPTRREKSKQREVEL
jgi:hypothetical protein